jgi:hypothetical protein
VGAGSHEGSLGAPVLVNGQVGPRPQSSHLRILQSRQRSYPTFQFTYFVEAKPQQVFKLYVMDPLPSHH